MLRYLVLPGLFLSMCLLGAVIVSQERPATPSAQMAVSLNDLFR